MWTILLSKFPPRFRPLSSTRSHPYVYFLSHTTPVAPFALAPYNRPCSWGCRCRATPNATCTATPGPTRPRVKCRHHQLLLPPPPPGLPWSRRLVARHPRCVPRLRDYATPLVDPATRFQATQELCEMAAMMESGGAPTTSSWLPVPRQWRSRLHGRAPHGRSQAPAAEPCRSCSPPRATRRWRRPSRQGKTPHSSLSAVRPHGQARLNVACVSMLLVSCCMFDVSRSFLRPDVSCSMF